MGSIIHTLHVPKMTTFINQALVAAAALKKKFLSSKSNSLKTEITSVLI